MCDPLIQAGDRIIVVQGDHAGRHGRVILTHDSQQTLVIRLVGLRPGLLQVALDRNEWGSWSGLIAEPYVRRARMETDAEFYLRFTAGFGALASEGEALDRCARRIGLERKEIPEDG